MTNPSFTDIYTESKLLVSPSPTYPIPPLKRDSSQVQQETDSLTKRVKSSHELQAKGLHFLTQDGIKSNVHNLEVLQKSTSIIPTESDSSITLSEYLDQMTEQDIIHSIESVRSSSCLQSISMINQSLEEDYKPIENQQQKPASPPQPPHHSFLSYASPLQSQAHSQLQEKQGRYATVMTNINKADLDGELFNMIDAFKTASSPGDNGPDRHLLESLQLIAHLTNIDHLDTYDQVLAHRKRNLQLYAGLADGSSQEAIDLRANWIRSATAWLEESYIDYIDQTLKDNAQVAKPGGSLVFMVRLKAFVGVTYGKHKEGWPAILEIVNDQPAWVLLYTSLRCGQHDSALQLLQREPELFQSEPDFVQQMMEYLESDKTLSKGTQEQVVIKYQQLKSQGVDAVDPYKLALFKIVGRCELHSNQTPSIVSTTEEYLWLQLTLLKEQPGHDFHVEQYTLKELQVRVAGFGAKRFDPTGAQPWSYFKMLLATCQFEQAVSYLYKNKQTQLDAVHIGIMLAYFGLLRVPKSSRPSTDMSKFLTENKTISTFTLSRMIHQYLKSSQLPTTDQFQYLFCLAWYAKHYGYVDDSLLEQAQAFCRDWILESNDYEWFLGSFVDDQRQPGFMDQYKRLLGFEDQDSYTKAFLIPLVGEYANRGQYAKATFVCELASDYNLAMEVLFYQLSQAFQRPANHLKNDASLQHLLDFTKSTLQRYDHNQYISKLVDDRKKHTVRAMVGFVKARQLYDLEQYEQALGAAFETGVVPPMAAASYASLSPVVDQFNLLDDGIANLVPDLVLMLMTILYKLWLHYRPSLVTQPVLKDTLTKIQNSVRTLLLFASMIRVKIPSETMNKLNNLDTKMSQ
ncbi:NIC-domain-containing protein [Hesseltinella vesiculosa]|uniref:Nuclear pore protein n=1 Tax=Hesseltinella vesiculosa TaxID=101127 RepID=A0A1X2GT29_9FUNG|nr:NIC-domain-containing protein [Hesseltinella vesiculosa]